MSSRYKTPVRFYSYTSVQSPPILGVKLDRILKYRVPQEELRSVILLRRLVESGWAASAKTLRTSALSLVYLTAEYRIAVWYRNLHTRLIGSILNDTYALLLDACVPFQRNTFRFSQASSQLSFAAKEQHFIANRNCLDHDHILHVHLHRS